MGKIKVTACDIEGLYVIEPAVFHDERGYFMETYNQNDFKEAGLDMVFVQRQPVHVCPRSAAGTSFSEAVSSGKAEVRAVRGSVFDVAVDLRADSQNLRKMVWCGADCRK